MKTTSVDNDIQEETVPVYDPNQLELQFTYRHTKLIHLDAILEMLDTEGKADYYKAVGDREKSVEHASQLLADKIDDWDFKRGTRDAKKIVIKYRIPREVFEPIVVAEYEKKIGKYDSDKIFDKNLTHALELSKHFKIRKNEQHNLAIQLYDSLMKSKDYENALELSEDEKLARNLFLDAAKNYATEFFIHNRELSDYSLKMLKKKTHSGSKRMREWVLAALPHRIADSTERMDSDEYISPLVKYAEQLKAPFTKEELKASYYQGIEMAAKIRPKSAYKLALEKSDEVQTARIAKIVVDEYIAEASKHEFQACYSYVIVENLALVGKHKLELGKGIKFAKDMYDKCMQNGHRYDTAAEIAKSCSLAESMLENAVTAYVEFQKAEAEKYSGKKQESDHIQYALEFAEEYNVDFETRKSLAEKLFKAKPSDDLKNLQSIARIGRKYGISEEAIKPIAELSIRLMRKDRDDYSDGKFEPSPKIDAFAKEFGFYEKYHALDVQGLVVRNAHKRKYEEIFELLKDQAITEEAVHQIGKEVFPIINSHEDTEYALRLIEATKLTYEDIKDSVESKFNEYDKPDKKIHDINNEYFMRRALNIACVFKMPAEYVVSSAEKYLTQCIKSHEYNAGVEAAKTYGLKSYNDLGQLVLLVETLDKSTFRKKVEN